MIIKLIKSILYIFLSIIVFINLFYFIIWFDITSFTYIKYNIGILILFVAVGSLIKRNINYIVISIVLYIIFFTYIFLTS